MPNKDEKTRRKELLHSLRNQERQKQRENLPVSILALKALFNFLELQLSQGACDHSLHLTREYIRRNAMDENLVIQWLEKHGGYCDCEALSNVGEIVADAVPGFDQIQNETGSVN